MSKLLLGSIALSVTLILQISVSQASVLNGQEIRSLVSGKKIYLKIPFGGEFPLRYGKTGSLKGDGTGTGLGKYFAPKDTGTWWIAQNQLCQKWTEWYKGRTACFIISDVKGGKFKWKRNDGKSGAGRVE